MTKLYSLNTVDMMVRDADYDWRIAGFTCRAFVGIGTVLSGLS